MGLTFKGKPTTLQSGDRIFFNRRAKTIAILRGAAPLHSDDGGGSKFFDPDLCSMPDTQRDRMVEFVAFTHGLKIRLLQRTGHKDLYEFF